MESQFGSVFRRRKLYERKSNYISQYFIWQYVNKYILNNILGLYLNMYNIPFIFIFCVDFDKSKDKLVKNNPITNYFRNPFVISPKIMYENQMHRKNI